MPKLDVYNLKREKVGAIDLADEVFAADVKEHLLHEVVTAQLADLEWTDRASLSRQQRPRRDRDRHDRCKR